MYRMLAIVVVALSASLGAAALGAADDSPGTSNQPAPAAADSCTAAAPAAAAELETFGAKDGTAYRIAGTYFWMR